MQDKLEKIKAIAEKKLNEISDLKELENLRVSIMGKKGEITQLSKSLATLSKEEKPKVGQVINQARKYIEEKMEKKLSELSLKEQNRKIKEETIDVTIAGKPFNIASKHPMTIVIEDIKKIFLGMGYSIAEGPDIEEDYYNFEALNIPKHHPAKDEQDTFYVDGGFLLRTQTSPVQVRIMEEKKLPIKIIAPGRVFRSDEVDATHSPVFHQLEGLVIDENITMADLKGTLITFAKELFGEDVKIRLRPHHFPFTEPSAEMDISCFACQGVGCKVCKSTGFIELLGCGMVHPKVLEMSGIDSRKYSGFAFGMGIERMAMQRYNITDLRIMYENDIRFLKQF